METFVPLYISNNCDSYCLMCGFNHSNTKLLRRTATDAEIEEQLKIIRDYERISAVCILTGELYSESARFNNLVCVCNAINRALMLGFEQIYFNIGSLSYNEIEYIKRIIIDPTKIVLSLFQETYDREAYKAFFGLHPECNSKADYQNRLDTIERWIEAGFKKIDIGILLGFKPIGNDVEKLVNYAKKYLDQGLEVYISTPRIKNGTINDEEYLNVLLQIHKAVPKAKLIITTREKLDFINSAIDIISVVSPGSSDICPYNTGLYISNNRRTSQFVIDEKRMRPYDVLCGLNTDEPILYFKSK